MLLPSGIAFGKDNIRTTLVHPSLCVGCVFPFLTELAVAALFGHW